MIIGYTRISTPSQNDQLQRDALERAGAERIFSDVGTGSSFERPGLKAALEFARDSQDEVVVWKLDRLGRHVGEIIGTVDDLGRRGIGFRSLTENLSADTASSRLLFTIVAALAQAEKDVLIERVNAGLDAARRRGVRLGRPNALTPEKEKMAAALLREGSMSVRAIAAQVGVSAPTIYRSFPGGKSAVQAG